MRFRKYNNDSARLDSRDNLNKLNEVGIDCPIFVAKDVSKFPWLHLTLSILQRYPKTLMTS